MATNLKKDERKAEKAARGEGGRFSVDIKLMLYGLGLAMIVFASVIMGVKVSIDHFNTKTVVQKVPVEAHKPGPIVQMVNDQVVNLKDKRFLRFTCAVQFAEDPVVFPEGGGGGHGGKAANPLAPYEAMIKDTIITVASEQTGEFLLRPDGKEKLKHLMTYRINHEFKQILERLEQENGEHHVPYVYKVYFTSFVIS